MQRGQLLYAKGTTLLCMVLSFFCQNISLVALNAMNLSLPVGDCRWNAWVPVFLESQRSDKTVSSQGGYRRRNEFLSKACIWEVLIK